MKTTATVMTKTKMMKTLMMIDFAVTKQWTVQPKKKDIYVRKKSNRFNKINTIFQMNETKLSMHAVLVVS